MFNKKNIDIKKKAQPPIQKTPDPEKELKDIQANTSRAHDSSSYAKRKQIEMFGYELDF